MILLTNVDASFNPKCPLLKPLKILWHPSSFYISNYFLSLPSPGFCLLKFSFHSFLSSFFLSFAVSDRLQEIEASLTRNPGLQYLCGRLGRGRQTPPLKPSHSVTITNNSCSILNARVHFLSCVCDGPTNRRINGPSLF